MAGRPGRWPLAALAASFGVVAILTVAANRTAALESDSNVGPILSPALPVLTRKVERQAGYRIHRVFTGRLQARRESPLGFDAAGRLDAVHVREGEEVSEGDILAALDTDRLSARRAELVSALAEAEANLALASATLHRLRGVLESGGVSRQGLDEAREARRAAVAARDLARQRIATVDVELAKSRLVAPFDGTVVERLADEGRVLATGDPVVRLQESAAPEIRIGVAGDAVDSLRPGEIYAIEHGRASLPARLRAVLPQRSARARTVDTLFDLVEANGSGPGLRPGDTVNLRVPVRVAEPGYWLPLNALTGGERGLWNLYVAEPAENTPIGLDATHRVTRRTVDLLHHEADRVFVRGMLDPGIPVITTGLHRVVPGQWVSIAEPRVGANTATPAPRDATISD